MNRRDMIRSTAAALTAAALSPAALHAAPSRKKMGVSTSSYGVRWRQDSDDGRLQHFRDGLDLIDHSHSLGAGGVQISVRGWSKDFASRVRERIERFGMFFEGQISLPRDSADQGRFDREVAHAREAGAGILRAVMLSGRRYETFRDLASWKEFKDRSWRSLVLARPVMEKHRVKLAMENHKDWRVEELREILQRIHNEWIGVNLDFGNSISLLEKPMQTIEGLAPYTFTTHFKDMAVQEYEEGFLLSEVPLGQGFLDLPRMIEILEQANPTVQYNLEMITRDPLRVPCLTDDYWLTLGELRGHHLAETLSMIRKHPPAAELPKVTGKSPGERAAYEEENVVKCFDFARTTLGL